MLVRPQGGDIARLEFKRRLEKDADAQEVQGPGGPWRHLPGSSRVAAAGAGDERGTGVFSGHRSSEA
ncbi:hypothetical protein COCNU_10G006660 [Cocos nucifera]|uniref:Uncharacterized protein n=1 Tax=Cocos nucifera TaxID=13894 RepID=A0A8K0IML7_COCNU|nr:hypothetical protein COCNU_10G006660 [Cocos nucifera]